MAKNTAMQAIPGLQAEEAKPVAPGVDWIDETVGALFDPIIVYPGGGWEQDLPEPLKKRLPLDRLAHNMLCLHGKADRDEACDTEALLYMYPRTMVAPLGEQWSRIYLYLGTKVMGEDKMPEDIRRTELDDYDMRELRDLKRWIRKKMLEARKERRKRERAQNSGKESEIAANSGSKPKIVAAQPERYRLF